MHRARSDGGNERRKHFALWLAGGWGMGMDWPYYVVMAVIIGHFAWQMLQFDVQRPERGLRIFRSNMQVGVLLIVAALAGTVLPV